MVSSSPEAPGSSNATGPAANGGELRALDGALRCVDVEVGRGRPASRGGPVTFVSTVWMADKTPADPRVELLSARAVVRPQRLEGIVGSSPRAADIDAILLAGAEPMRAGGSRRCALLADKAQALRSGIPGVIIGEDLLVVIELQAAGEN
jgi:hypothetical protein